MIYNYNFNEQHHSNTKFVIYLISNSACNKYYVGQTRRELKRRWADYKIDLFIPIKVKNRTGCNIHFRRSVQKHFKKLQNSDFLVFSILEVIDFEQKLTIEERIALINEREKYWISEFRNRYGENKIYNILEGGKNNKLIFSKSPEDTRKRYRIARQKFLASEEGQALRIRLSEKLKGRKSPLLGKSISDSHREKISKATQGKNNPNFGKKHSEETRRKIGEKNKNFSPEIREKIRRANLGKNPINKGKKWKDLYPADVVENMKKAVIEANKKRVFSNEYRQKLREKMLGKQWGKHSEEQKQKWSQQRKNVSFEERYGVERAKQIKEKLKLVTKSRNAKYIDLSINPLMSPSGDLFYEIRGLHEFCKTHRLHHRLLKEVIYGKVKKHKGWRLKNTII